jgi:hypothetical protein
MLAGDPPFGGSNFQMLLARKLSEPAPRLSTLRPAVAPALEEAITRALSQAPADRFETATAFADAATKGEALDSPQDRPAFPIRGALWRDGARPRLARSVSSVWATCAGSDGAFGFCVNDTGGTTQRSPTPHSDARRPRRRGAPFENLVRGEICIGMTDRV